MPDEFTSYNASGFHHDPLVDISNLRQTLKGYGSTEAFVKEVLQNADDARAKVLRIAWVSGIPEADHPLLQGPALLIVNDAPFEEKHARAIKRMGLGSKGGEEHSIGKFGLGIKSVFQVCETLMFFANPPEGGEDFRIIGVLNPWHGIHHADWNTLSSEDVRRIEATSTSLRPPNEPWFLMWLPLRRKAHLFDLDGSEVAAIRKEFPGDLEQASPGISVLVQELIPILLPTLKSVERVDFLPAMEKPGGSEAQTVRLAEGASRLQFDINQRDDGNFEGMILNNERAPTNYVGLTRWIVDPELDRLKQSDFWPRVVVIRDDGSDVDELEKAHPHCGAVIHYAPTKGRGRIQILWSVFLPVGEDPFEELDLDLQFDIKLNLHGYFFLNSTRTQIDGLDHETAFHTSVEQSRESHICRDWNRILASQGTLPLLPLLLEKFVASQAANDQIETAKRLTLSLNRSKLVDLFHSQITSSHAWAFRLTQNGGHWAACMVSNKVLKLNPPPRGQLATLHLALPGINSWLDSDNEVHLVIVGCGEEFPSLAGPNLSEWSLEDIETVLGCCLQDHFVAYERALNYLLFEFIQPLSRELKEKVFRELLEDVRLFLISAGDSSELASARTILNLIEARQLYAAKSDPQLFKQLIAVLPEKNIRQNSKDFSGLWEPFSNLPHLDSAEAARLILNADALGQVAGRKALLTHLLQVREMAHAEEHERLALRYLIHANSDYRNTSTLLFRQSYQEASAWDRVAIYILNECAESWRCVSKEFDFVQSDCEWLGIETIGAGTVKNLLKEFGWQISFFELPVDDREFLIKNIEDNDLLRSLSLHQLASGKLTSVSGHTYLDANFQFDVSLRPLWEDLASSANVVNRSKDPIVRVRQEQIFGDQVLKENGIMRLAAEHGEPGRFWPLIMAALAKIGTPSPEVRDLLVAKEWLPLRAQAGFTRPLQIISLSSADEAIQQALPAGQFHPVTPLNLLDEIRQHQGFNALREKVFPGKRQALDLLANTLLQEQSYLTGLPAIERPSDLKRLVNCLSGWSSPLFQVLPVLSAIVNIEDEVVTQLCCETLGVTLSGAATGQAYVQILSQIQSRHATSIPEQKEELLGQHLAFFSAALKFGRWAAVRGEIKLPSKLGHWKPCSELVLSFRGISEQYELATRYADPLKSALSDDQPSPCEETSKADPVNSPISIQKSIETLNTYFAAFDGKLPEASIGAFAVCLGGRTENLAWAANLLNVVDIQSVVNLIIPEDKQDEVSANAVEFVQLDNSKKTIQYRRRICWKETYFQVSIYEGETVEVLTLTNQAIRLPVEPETESLLFGPSVFASTSQVTQSATEGLVHKLQLLAPKFFLERSDEEILSLLRKTGEILLEEVFWVYELGGFRKFIDQSKSSDGSLQLRIAQRMIVKSGDNLIQALGTHRHPTIRGTLHKWNRAKHLEAQVEEGWAEKSAANEARELLKQAEAEFRSFLEETLETQQVFIEAVRRKMKQFQYTCDSIAFELFQNADDAYVELDNLGEWDSTSQARFVIQVDGGSVRFIHWGRPIDYPRNSTGTNVKETGYDRDLQKMLIMNSSDKSMEGDEEPSRTGKFGLGFKSVHFATANPAVVSDKLAFEIRAGLFPTRLPPSDDRRTQLYQILEAYKSIYSTPGTIFDLPLEAKLTSPGILLDRFIDLGCLLSVFAKKIQLVEIKGYLESGQENILFHWDPSPVGLTGSSTGSLGRVKGKSLNGILFQANHAGSACGCSILFGTGSQGFLEFPAEVPRVWVTAPTWEQSSHGVLVNGQFEVDTGRRQLALEASGNARLAEAFGSEVGKFLCELAEEIEADWETMRTNLKIANDVNRDDFWTTLWEVVVNPRVALNGDGGGKADELFNRILFCSRRSGYGRLICNHRVCPSGLGTEGGHLVRMDEVHTVIVGILDRQCWMFDQVLKWPGFHKVFNPSTAISESRIAKVAEQQMPWLPMGDCRRVSLLEALLHALGSEKHVSPETAVVLGKVLSKESQVKVLAQDQRAKSEFDELENALKDIRFEAADSTLSKAADLVTGKLGRDEQLRAAFAPANCCLSSKYYAEGIDFFRLCRGEISADSQKLAGWAKGATDGRLSAVFRYLIEGEPGIRDNLLKGLGVNWFSCVRVSASFSSLSTEEQRRLHLLFDYEVTVSQYSSYENDEGLEEPQFSREDFRSPEELLAWWKGCGSPTHPYTFTGEIRGYLFPSVVNQEGDDVVRAVLSAPDSPEGREAWFRTLCYCCLMGARVHPSMIKRFWAEELEGRDFFRLIIPKSGTLVSDDAGFIQNTRDLFDQIIHRYLRGENAAGEDAELWRRIFYDSRKMFLSVYVNELPSLFLEVAPQLGGAEQAIRLLKSGEFPGNQPLKAVIGQSFTSPLFLLMRELRRLRVIDQARFDPTCFYVRPSIRRAAARIGAIDLRSSYSFDELLVYSRDIFEWTNKSTVADEFTNGVFDIPLFHLSETKAYDKL